MNIEIDNLLKSLDEIHIPELDLQIMTAEEYDVYWLKQQEEQEDND